MTSQISLLGLAALFLLALLACGSSRAVTSTPGPTLTATPAPMPTAAPEPEAGSVEIGIRYRYIVYTHCGVRDTYFDGRWWLAAPVLGEGSNPPGWGITRDTGPIELITTDRALFRADSGNQAFFNPTQEDGPSKLCA